MPHDLVHSTTNVTTRTDRRISLCSVVFSHIPRLVFFFAMKAARFHAEERLTLAPSFTVVVC